VSTWLYFLCGEDKFFLSLDKYLEKVFVKVISVLARSANKVRMTNCEISHACFETDEDVLIKFWKAING